MKDKETLETGAVVCKLADPIEDQINNLFANGVVAASVIIRGVLLAANDLLRMVELAVGSRTNLVTDSRLKVDIDGAGDVLSRACFRKEGVEGVVASSDCHVGGHLAIGLDSMLEAVELPAAIAGLNTGLAHVDTDAF